MNDWTVQEILKAKCRTESVKKKKKENVYYMHI